MSSEWWLCQCRCERLGLTSLAYLWRRDQAQLLDEMIVSGISAIIIKVASIGELHCLSLCVCVFVCVCVCVKPHTGPGLSESHLGCSLQQMQPHLTELVSSSAT